LDRASHAAAKGDFSLNDRKSLAELQREHEAKMGRLEADRAIFKMKID
jgi:hypothetical protein